MFVESLIFLAGTGLITACWVSTCEDGRARKAKKKSRRKVVHISDHKKKSVSKKNTRHRKAA